MNCKGFILALLLSTSFGMQAGWKRRARAFFKSLARIGRTQQEDTYSDCSPTLDDAGNEGALAAAASEMLTESDQCGDDLETSDSFGETGTTTVYVVSSQEDTDEFEEVEVVEVHGINARREHVVLRISRSSSSIASSTRSLPIMR